MWRQKSPANEPKMDAEKRFKNDDNLLYKKATLFYRYLTPKNTIKTLLKKGVPMNRKWTPKNRFKTTIICDTKKPLYFNEKRRPKTGMEFCFYFAALFYGYLTTILGGFFGGLNTHGFFQGSGFFIVGFFIWLVFIG